MNQPARCGRPQSRSRRVAASRATGGSPRKCSPCGCELFIARRGHFSRLTAGLINYLSCALAFGRQASLSGLILEEAATNSSKTLNSLDAWRGLTGRKRSLIASTARRAELSGKRSCWRQVQTYQRTDSSAGRLGPSRSNALSLAGLLAENARRGGSEGSLQLAAGEQVSAAPTSNR